jgi:hypothetical protein
MLCSQRFGGKSVFWSGWLDCSFGPPESCMLLEAWCGVHLEEVGNANICRVKLSNNQQSAVGGSRFG